MRSEDGRVELFLEDILQVLFNHSEKENNPVILTTALVQNVINYIRHNPARFPEPNLRPVPSMVLKLLIEAEKVGEVILSREGSAIIRVNFSGYYIRKIKQRMHDLRKNPETPLPTVSTLVLDIPEKMVTVINAKDELISFLEKKEEAFRENNEEEFTEHDNRVIRLIFSPDIEPVLIPYHYSFRELALVCLQKIRFYLRNERNQSYMRQKMMGLFRHREKMVEETFTAILSRPEVILEDIWKPNEFSYYFWIQLTSGISKEYSEKKEKTINEQNYTQSAIILGMLLAHRKALLQKDSDSSAALKEIERKLRTAPYAFTLQNIFEFTDKKGVLITKKVSREDIIKFIEQQEIPQGSERIPSLIKIHTRNNHREYIRKDLYLMYFFQHAREAGEKVSKKIISEWSTALNLGVKLFEMQNQDAFEAMINQKLQQLDPVLAVMLDFSTLYLVSQEAPVTEQTKADLRKILDPKKLELKPLYEFFDLDRVRMFADAKLLLPVWKTIPGLSGLLRFLQKMFIGVDRHEEAERLRLLEENRSTTLTHQKKQRRQRTSIREPEPVETPVSRTVQVETPVQKSKPTRQKPAVAEKKAVVQKTVGAQQSSKERMQAAVKKLETRLSDGYSSLEEARTKTLEKWNTIIDPKNRKNLTIDVESLARDQARKILQKRGSGAPTVERIIALAENISGQDVFDTIRDRKSLQDFIALTITKYLKEG
ncbi:hypothetical protein [Spirochaeta dissipatitropha]